MLREGLRGNSFRRGENLEYWKYRIGMEERLRKIEQIDCCSFCRKKNVAGRKMELMKTTSHHQTWFLQLVVFS
jgi:hypothetical protein